MMLPDMMDGARSKKWSVNIRKLSADKIEFLSGPHLLSNLTGKGPTVSSEESTQEHENTQPLPLDHNVTVPKILVSRMTS